MIGEKSIITVQEAADKWGISTRRVRMLCAEGKVDGARREGKAWLIPAEAARPIDGRSVRYSEIPRALVSLVKEVEALKAKCAALRPLSEGELSRLREQFIIDYTHSSTAIEGNTLTLSETALVLEGITIAQKPLKDHLEAIGHRDAFKFLEAQVSADAPISERFVKELHTLVLADKPEDRGVYRRIPVIITGAAHTPPQPYLIVPQMEEWICDYQATKLNPLIAAALFHIRFEAIHPFIDGNGRTGRLLVNFMLMRAGYLPISIKYESRLAYYQAFTTYHTTGSLEPMARIILEAEKSRLQEWLNIIKVTDNR
ncbi:MAG: Fic family protein [Kiritimatiellae bacterium]|nr:Fic family protein [Kiritimatiellia bacterium]